MHGTTVMQEGTQIGDYSIVITEGLAIREALIVAVKKTFIRLY